MPEYGYRPNKQTKPLVNIPTMEDKQTIPYGELRVHPGGYDFNTYAKTNEDSYRDTEDKRDTQAWLKRTWQPLATRKLEMEDIPDIVTTYGGYSKGFMLPGDPHNRIAVSPDFSDITGRSTKEFDFKNPEHRAVAFHESGHKLTGINDLYIPRKMENIPFFYQNTNAVSSDPTMTEKGSIVPYDTTYSALKDLLDEEYTQEVKKLGEPNIADKLMELFMGEKGRIAPPPSSFYDNKAVRRKMLIDNRHQIESREAARKRARDIEDGIYKKP